MRKSVKAKPAGILLDARGREIAMDAGPCLWCGEWVTEGRDLAGATRPFDPCWNIDGDFGCDRSPQTSEDGCGDHARPYDLARAILKPRAERLLTKMLHTLSTGSCSAALEGRDA